MDVEGGRGPILLKAGLKPTRRATPGALSPSMYCTVYCTSACMPVTRECTVLQPACTCVFRRPASVLLSGRAKAFETAPPACDFPSDLRRPVDTLEGTAPGENGTGRGRVWRVNSWTLVPARPRPLAAMVVVPSPGQVLTPTPSPDLHRVATRAHLGCWKDWEGGTRGPEDDTPPCCHNAGGGGEGRAVGMRNLFRRPPHSRPAVLKPALSGTSHQARPRRLVRRLVISLHSRLVAYR